MSEKVSMTLPVYHERKNLERFVSAFDGELDPTGEDCVVLLLDDSSTDGSDASTSTLPEKNARIQVIQFCRNFGPKAAMDADFNCAEGGIPISRNAEAHNDPADIPAILAKLPGRYDAVSCWRRRRLPSKWANALTLRISGVRFHDDSCTLKAYQREVVEQVRLAGEMHRRVPVYASWAGGKVAETPVRRHARASGSSKCRLSRTAKVILDLVTVKMPGGCFTKPRYFSGGVDLIACSGAFVCALLTLYDKIFVGAQACPNPLLLLAVFLFPLGIQSLLAGLVAALVIRAYFEYQGKTPCIVRQGHHFA